MILDQKALKAITEMKAKGLSQSKMAEVINDMGYHKKNGKKYCQSSISKFCRDNGIRTYDTRKTKVTKTVEKNVTSFIINNTTLTKSQKLKMLEVIL